MLWRYRKRVFARELIFIAAAVLFSLPLYLLIEMSLKSPAETAQSPLGLPKHVVFSNFSTAWTTAGGGGMGGALVTSLLITVCAVGLLLALGLLAAFAIARHTSRMSTGVYVLFVGGLMVPTQLGTIPLYSAMRSFGLIGTPLGVILVYLGQLMPLTVFLLTGFIRRLPPEYEEAAYVDGAGHVRTLVRVVLPLLRPIVATVLIIDGLVIWNDFFVPLLWLAGSGHQTLPLALYSFVGAYTSQWNVIFAGIVIVIGPILCLYVLTQRHMIRGFTSGIRG
jgi:raffinose/stachyose/melibiose transport system permease protein